MAKNVIIVVPDGMGWEMARAGAIAKQIDQGHTGTTLADFYTEGKGEGLSFQELEGFTYATTYPGVIEGSKANSVFEGNPLERPTGEGELRDENFQFDPTFNPGEFLDADGNLVGYDVELAGPNPWTTIDPEYIKLGYTGSSQAATNIFSGVKTFNPALGVDIFEQPAKTILEIAQELGKSTGTISDVPFSHATPAGPAAHVNHRNKYDGDYPELDNITQQMLRLTQPDIILGGGHPLDLGNHTEEGGESTYRFINESTYEELSNNPNPEDNIYGYNFLERGMDAAESLMDAVSELDPTAGDKIFGLYGARGQNGNLPMRSGDGSYDRTGFNTFGHRSSQREGNEDLAEGEEGSFVDQGYVRPLAPGETDEEFIARELNENPTIMEMTQASLDFLSKNEDGFFLQVELGDYDWVLHDNNMDTLLGRNIDLDLTVELITDWIGENGGWEENLLLVVPDHDHYLTLNDNFPELYREYGPQALTEFFNTEDAGHFWGSDPEDKYQWGNHSNRAVPIYYQGAGSEILDNLIGTGYEMYGEEVPGIEDHIDLVHIFQTMNEALLMSVEQPVETGTVFGTGENDTLVAHSNTFVFAGEGNDTILALGTDNRLFGGPGDDVLFAGPGGNILTGGEGSDQFWLVYDGLPESANIVTDFQLGEDVLGIAGLSGIRSLGDINMAQMGDDTLISIRDTDVAVLSGVQANTLASDNFVFV
ncbi:MAG: alkaline phosphatase [Rivularia sp. (in: cyanobacteria)]